MSAVRIHTDSGGSGGPLMPGLGHNCHAEAPERVWDLFERILDE